ncbi:hypothetical protein ACHAXS_008734 [Conticribra weissflogii]
MTRASIENSSKTRRRTTQKRSCLSFLSRGGGGGGLLAASCCLSTALSAGTLATTERDHGPARAFFAGENHSRLRRRSPEKDGENERMPVNRGGIGSVQDDPPPQTRSNSNARRRRQRRRRRIQNDNSDEPTPVCTSTALQPSQSLLPNQFLCFGHLRFGISSSSGRFLLGLSSTPDYGLDVLPSQIVWIAEPNSLNLFTDGNDARFHEVVLSSRGNLIGYDEDGNQIYDSNYDYSARLEGKEDDSVLTFSNSCNGEGVESIPEEELCVRLTSPPTAGFPYGVVTWGLTVDLNVDLSLEEVPAALDVNEDVPESDGASEVGNIGGGGGGGDAQSLAVTDSPTGVPTAQPTTDVPTKQATTSSGNNEQFAGNAIIWGTVWLDENRDYRMDFAEERMAEVKVDLYDCSSSSQPVENIDDSIPMDSTYTSIDGMYFFQVAQGGMYRAHFDMEGRPYSYSTGADGNNEDGAIDQGGWTPCQQSTSVSPIEWNAGLIAMGSSTMEEDAAMEEPASVQEIAEDGKNGENSDSMQSFELEDSPEQEEQDIAADFPAMEDGAEGNAETSAASLETSLVSEEPGSQHQQRPSSSISSSSISSATASIGGSIYLDLNANGIIDGKEGFSANDGFTVDDAIVQILLIDCETNYAVDYPKNTTVPGIYSFSDLNAGTFQVEFVVSHLSPDGTVGGEDPLYSFLDENGVDTESSSKKSECTPLASGQTIDSLNVGLFPIPVEVAAKSADGIAAMEEEDAPLEPFSASAADEAEQTVAGGERTNLRASAAPTSKQGGQGGNKQSVIAGAVAGVFGCCIFALGLFAMMRRRKNSSSHRVKEMLSRVSSSQDHGNSGEERSIGSSVKDDLASRTDNKSLDSMFVEASLAGEERTNLVSKPGVDDDSDSDSDSDSSSDDSDSDSSSSESGGEESSDQPFSESEEGSIEICDDGNFVIHEKSNVPEEQKVVQKDIMKKPSVDLDQNRYQHPYHSSISVTSDTFSDGPFESSDDESESSAEIMKHLAPHLKSQKSLSSTGESSGGSYTDGTMGQENHEDSSVYPSYQENQNNTTEEQYQQQQQQIRDQDSRYYSNYHHPNQPSYPALYSNMEDEASCSELSATHSHSSNDHMQYRNYVNDRGNLPDHQGYGHDQQPHHSHQGYHYHQQGEWDSSHYGAHGHAQYYDQHGQHYDYQYQYANSGGYDGSHHDYGDASVNSARSADPPAASYQQLSDSQNSDINDGRHDYSYNEWDRRSPSSDQGIEVHDHVYYGSGYQGHHSIGDQDPTRTGNSFHSVATTETEETARWSNVSSKQRPKSTPRSWRQTDDAIPENDPIHFEAYMSSNDTNYYDRNAADDANDTKSILSAGSDQSADPPGASYKVLQFPPPPPRRLPPPPPPRR